MADSDLIYIYPNSISTEATNLINSRFITTNSKDNATIIFCRFKNKLDKAEISQFNDLRAIFTCTTGSDHIDCTFCEERGIDIYTLFDNRDDLEKITSSCEFALILCSTVKLIRLDASGELMIRSIESNILPKRQLLRIDLYL